MEMSFSGIYVIPIAQCAFLVLSSPSKLQGGPKAKRASLTKNLAVSDFCL